MEDAKDQIIQSGIFDDYLNQGASPEEQRAQYMNLRAALRYNPESGKFAAMLPSTDPITRTTVTRELRDLPTMPALETYRNLEKYKSLGPDDLENAYATLLSQGADAPELQDQAKVLRFLRNFHGAAASPESTAKSLFLLSPGKTPLGVADIDKHRSQKVFFRDEQLKTTELYRDAAEQLGYGGTGQMFEQYMGMLPGAGNSTYRRIKETARPFYSRYWDFNETAPEDDLMAEFEKPEKTPETSFVDRNRKKLFKTARGAQLPESLEADKELDEIERQKAMRSYYKRMAEKSSMERAAASSGANVPAYDKEAGQYVYPGAVREESKEEMPADVGETPEQDIVSPKHQAQEMAHEFMLGKTGDMAGSEAPKPKPAAPSAPTAPKPSPKKPSEPETGDVLLAYLKKHTEFGTDEGYDIAGRPTRGRSTTGQKLRETKHAFLGQGGEGSGMGLGAKVGQTAHIHGLHEFMRKASRKMQALKPQNQIREHVSENVIEQTNAKNNKPPTTTLNYNPGSFKGEKPYSILDKTLITPKKTQDDGNLGAHKG